MVAEEAALGGGRRLKSNFAQSGCCKMTIEDHAFRSPSRKAC